MIQILARIASHTARGIFGLLLLNGGSIIRKELMEAGYPSTIIRENMLKLEAGGFVIKITTGVYRAMEYPNGIPTPSNGIPSNEQSNGIPAESNGIPLKEEILESASPKKYVRRPLLSNGIPLESNGIPASAVNVVNNVINKTKLTNVSPLISSTGELEAFTAVYNDAFNILHHSYNYLCQPQNQTCRRTGCKSGRNRFL